jgi:hypothetical protein
MVLLMMVRGVEWVERAGELVVPEDFKDPDHRAIFQALLADPEMRAPPSSMDPVTARRLEEILSDREDLSRGIDAFTDAVRRMRGSDLDRRIEELDERSRAATDEGRQTLWIEMQKLRKERGELDMPIRRPRAASFWQEGREEPNKGRR